MFNLSDEERKRIIKKRLLRELREFAEQHKDGFPMKILAGKYAKSLKNLVAGGFPEFISALETEGLVRIEYQANGARSVYLTDEMPKVAEKVWF